MSSASHSQHSNPSLDATVHLGRQLRWLREQKGLSIHDVAERLKLPARQIETLENGVYDGLPEPVFVRGFLRSYGRFLDMDEGQLTAYLDNISPPDLMKFAGNTRKKGSVNYVNTRVKKSFPKWIFGVLALALVGGGIYVWQTKSNEENSRQDQISTIPTPPSDTNLNTNNLVEKPMTSSDTATETATLSASSSSQTAFAPPVAASLPAVTGVAGELVITARNRTMLTVTDVQGNVLISKIVPAGSEHRFKEGAPFEVRMGYAVGSTATFNGQEIDLNSKRNGGKSVAFTAGEMPNP